METPCSSFLFRCLQCYLRTTFSLENHLRTFLSYSHMTPPGSAADLRRSSRIYETWFASFAGAYTFKAHGSYVQQQIVMNEFNKLLKTRLTYTSLLLFVLFLVHRTLRTSNLVFGQPSQVQAMVYLFAV